MADDSQQIQEHATKHYKEDDHDKFLIRRIGKMRFHSILTDVVLNVENREFPAHKNVLAASSDYFMAMFSGQMAVASDSVTIREVTADAMKLLLNFIYTGELLITEDNVEEVFCGSCLLLLESVTKACCQFIEERLTLGNCWGIRTLADKFHCRDMLNTVNRFIQQTFRDVVQGEEFLLLPTSEIENLLSDDYIVVTSEEQVFDALVKWISHDIDARKFDFPSLLKHVRLTHLRQEYFDDTVATYSLVSQIPEAHEIVSIARNVLAGLTSSQETETENTSTSASSSCDIPESWHNPRRCLRFVEVAVTVGGGALCNFYDSKDDTWVPLSPPVTRHCPGLATLDNNIFIVGGSKEWKRYNRCEKYEPERNEWSLIESMKIGRSNIGLIALNGLLYAIGGYDGNVVVSDMECYNPKKDEWTFKKKMHNCRDGACYVTDGILIYAISGYDGNNYLGSVEVYDPLIDKWTIGEVPSIVERREDAMAEAYEGKVYVIGGYYNNIFYSSVEELDIDSNSWEFKSSMPCGSRYHAGSAIINSTIYICGGWTGQGLATNKVECYHIPTDTWSSISSLPAPSAARTVSCQFPRTMIKKLKKYQRSGKKDTGDKSQAKDHSSASSGTSDKSEAKDHSSSGGPGV